MTEAFVCAAVRAPFGRLGGALALGHPLGASGARPALGLERPG